MTAWRPEDDNTPYEELGGLRRHPLSEDEVQALARAGLGKSSVVVRVAATDTIRGTHGLSGVAEDSTTRKTGIAMVRRAARAGQIGRAIGAGQSPSEIAATYRARDDRRQSASETPPEL